MMHIRHECNLLLKYRFFVTNFTENLLIDEFKSIQDSNLNQTMSYINDMWIPSLINIIKSSF